MIGLMVKLYKPVIALALLMPGMVFLQGCTVAVIGAGEQVYSHVRGDLQGITPEPLESVYPASVEAIKSLQDYNMVEQNVNVLSGQIVAYDPEARKVQIDLKKTEHDQTEVTIRIGVLGNKLESVYIYDRIRHYLKENPIGAGRELRQGGA